VKPYVRDSQTRYRVVSLIISDLFARGIIRFDDDTRALLFDEEAINDEKIRRFG
jgi:hypothetical protein